MEVKRLAIQLLLGSFLCNLINVRSMPNKYGLLVSARYSAAWSHMQG